MYTFQLSLLVHLDIFPEKYLKGVIIFKNFLPHYLSQLMVTISKVLDKNEMEVMLCISLAKPTLNSGDSCQNHLNYSTWQSSHQL